MVKKKFLRKKVLVALAAMAVIGGTVIMAGDHHPAQAQQGAMPAVPVTVVTVQKQNLRPWTSYSGRLTAVDQAWIRPQVGGRVTEVRFEDGQKVKAGDILFVIDPATYQAVYDKATANLAAAGNNARLAHQELVRAQGLLKSGTIPQRQYDERVNADSVASAQIRVAQAEVKQAAIDLDHAYVKAPFDGRVGRAEVTVGNLVQASPGTPPVLTTLVAADNIYADFEIDEQTYIRQMRPQAQNQDQIRQIPVELYLRDGGDRLATGTIHAFDNMIDTGSGTMRTRARFDNRDGKLVPGMFVTVKVAGQQTEQIAIPERAISTDQNRKFVYVVSKENKVQYRPVTLGAQIGDKRAIADGLAEGEKVIVDGIQHVRPDADVAPSEQSSEQSGQG